MKTNKFFQVAVFLLFIAAFCFVCPNKNALAEELEQSMFEISYSCADYDNSSGEILDDYSFTVNRTNNSWTLAEGYSLEYRFDFAGEVKTTATGATSYQLQKNESVHTLNVSVFLKLDGELKEELPLPSMSFKNGELYEQPEIDPEEPVVDDNPPILTEENIVLTSDYDLSGQNYAKYAFSIDLIDVYLGELYKTSVEWNFDGNLYVFENSLETTMTTTIDPEKAHSLSVKVSIVRISDDTVVSSLALPVRYYKDGKILQNYTDSDVNEPLNELFPVNKIILPAIALLMIIFYCFYFKKERMTGGLDMTIDRLSNILGVSSSIEKITNDANLNEKKKLAATRKLYRNVKLDLNGTLNMLKSSSLEADVSVNTKFAIEKLSAAVEFANVDYKQYSLEELNAHIDELLKKHISPSIGACKQLASTNKRYLKKYDNEQF